MDTIDFKQWFQASPNAYLMLTPQFEVVWANAAFLLLARRQLEQIVASSVLTALSPEHDACTR